MIDKIVQLYNAFSGWINSGVIIAFIGYLSTRYGYKKVKARYDDSSDDRDYQNEQHLRRDWFEATDRINKMIDSNTELQNSNIELQKSNKELQEKADSLISTVDQQKDIMLQQSQIIESLNVKIKEWLHILEKVTSKNKEEL